MRTTRLWVTRSRLLVAVIATVAMTLTTGMSSAGAQDQSSLLDLRSLGNWPTWQKDAFGTRFNPVEQQITPSTVGNLSLKWAFTYANVPFATTGSQPAVVDGTLYVGAPDAKFFALDAKTGATIWTFDLTPISGPVDNVFNVNQVRDGAAVAGGKVHFGDSRGWVYAVNVADGSLAWATRVDSHPMARMTGSPLVYDGVVYIGVSGAESGVPGQNQNYPCCTHRGSVVALDGATGAVRWRYFTMRAAERAGTWPSGAARFAPSGGGVWSSPVINPLNRTLYIGTGQNYTGEEGDIDSVLALNIDTGAIRWKRRMTFPDTYTTACNDPALSAYCPQAATGGAKDHDFGSTPNLFIAGGRILVGAGQKSGMYYAFDADTGATVWERMLVRPDQIFGAGVEWGTSYDGSRLYVATWRADPGVLYALDPATGAILWQTPNPPDGCTTGGAAASPELCALALTPAVTTSPGLVYEGSSDGKFRVYSSTTGQVLWTYDTVRDFAGVNGLPGRGSAVSGNGGAVVSDGMVYVQSGYYPFYPSDKGHVLLAFGP